MSFIQHVLDQFIATPFWEWIAFLFALTQVFLAYLNKPQNFYAGILSVIIYAWLFFEAGLYAESLLNLYYLVISITGIFIWTRTTNPNPISYSTAKQLFIAFAIFVVSLGVIFYVLKNYTPSTVPFQDAFVASIAWSGSWLLMKRKIENWLVLNISNLIAIPLQYSKGLELTSLLTVVYFIMGIAGYWKWRKIIKANSEVVAL